jgi:hypothetical protein
MLLHFLLPIGLAVDPCFQLHLFHHLGSESYVKGSICHGLFWTHRRGFGPICAYSAQTASTCLPRYPVTVADAQARIRGPYSTSPPPVEKQLPEVVQSARPVVSSLSTMMLSTNSPSSRGQSTAGISIVAMGDCGVREAALRPTADLLATSLADRDATFLLGDLYYPLGIDKNQGTSDPRLSRLVTSLTRGNNGPLYPVLGNHDWHGDWQAEIAFSRMNTRWVFPNRYYFQRIQKRDLIVCAWFIDTDKKMFDEEQKKWFRSSLSAEHTSCTWKVVAGHHFIVSGGEYADNQWLISELLPSLDEYRIHIYLAGHEHQSQVIKVKDHPTWFLTAGALGDLRDKVNRGHEGLLFINKADVAVLYLNFTRESVRYRYIKTYEPGAGKILFDGSIPA